MVNSFLETARGHFSLLRNAEIEYSNVINGLILHYLSDSEDETRIPFHLKDLCRDKDTLTTTLAVSRDIHLQVNIESLKIVQINNNEIIDKQFTGDRRSREAHDKSTRQLAQRLY